MNLMIIGEPKITVAKTCKVFIAEDVDMAKSLFNIVAPIIIETLTLKESFKEKRPKKNWEPKFYHQRNR